MDIGADHGSVWAMIETPPPFSMRDIARWLATPKRGCRLVIGITTRQQCVPGIVPGRTSVLPLLVMAATAARLHLDTRRPVQRLANAEGFASERNRRAIRF
jgi:hypothetical protein